MTNKSIPPNGFPANAENYSADGIVYATSVANTTTANRMQVNSGTENVQTRAGGSTDWGSVPCVLSVDSIDRTAPTTGDFIDTIEIKADTLEREGDTIEIDLIFQIGSAPAISKSFDFYVQTPAVTLYTLPSSSYSAGNLKVRLTLTRKFGVNTIDAITEIPSIAGAALNEVSLTNSTNFQFSADQNILIRDQSGGNGLITLKYSKVTKLSA